MVYNIFLYFCHDNLSSVHVGQINNLDEESLTKSQNEISGYKTSYRWTFEGCFLAKFCMVYETVTL